MKNGKNIEIAYTNIRSKALAQGALIDVSLMAKSMGFAHPVALTREAFKQSVKVPIKNHRDDEDDLLSAVLWMLRNAIEERPLKNPHYFSVRVHGGPNKIRTVILRGDLHYGDSGETVITVMMPIESDFRSASEYAKTTSNQ